MTQAFFSQVLGFPITMEPDWNESSCVFKFGETPPIIENDEAYGTSCYITCQIRGVDGVVMVNPTEYTDSNVDKNDNDKKEAYFVSGDGIVRCN